MKWLDRKIAAYQEQAEKTFARLQNASPEDLQATQLNVLQSAAGTFDPATAAALSNPEAAQFLGLSQDEQMRQQHELQAYGQRMKVLWDSGTPVEVELLAVEATGKILGGQRQFEIRVQVSGAGEPYPASVVQVIPAPMIGNYTVGARFGGRADPQDRTSVGIFEKIG